jgi:hypothetical protein
MTPEIKGHVHSRPITFHLTYYGSPYLTHQYPQVMDAPDSKVDAARAEFCPPYKPARWGEFLVAVLGKSVSSRFLAEETGTPVSPVRAMRPLSPSVASPPGRATSPKATSPKPTSQQVRRKSSGVKVAEHTPTNLDYVAASAVGLMVLIIAAALSPGGLDAVEQKTKLLIAAVTKTAGLNTETAKWITQVVTVGGTLALSGAVVGAVIMALATIVVYAVFASK